MAALPGPLPPRAVPLAPRRPFEDVPRGRRAPSRPARGFRLSPGVRRDGGARGRRDREPRRGKARRPLLAARAGARPRRGDEGGDPGDARADRGLRGRCSRRIPEAPEGAAVHEPPRHRHRRLGSRAAIRRGRARLAARPDAAFLLRQHRSRRHGPRAVAHRVDRRGPARDAHGRDLEIGRNEGDAQRDARGGRRLPPRGPRLPEARGRRHGQGERARRGGRARRLAEPLPDVGLGGRTHVGAFRRRPPARGAPGARRGGASRGRRRVRRGDARRERSRRTPRRCSRSRGTGRRREKG